MSEAERTVPSRNAVVRFVLEILALGVFGYWGYSQGETQLVKLGLGIGLPTVVAVVWGTFGSPAAPRRLAQPWRTGLELLILAGGAVGLLALGFPILAAAFALAAAINTALLALERA